MGAKGEAAVSWSGRIGEVCMSGEEADIVGLLASQRIYVCCMGLIMVPIRIPWLHDLWLDCVCNEVSR